MTVNFTRWRKRPSGNLTADILNPILHITAVVEDRTVEVEGRSMSPDEARLYGVRLIEAAALAAGDSTIREVPPTNE